MPSFLCRCGIRIDYTRIPADSAYQLVEDTKIDVENDSKYLARWEEATQVLECADCKRLWIFWNGMANSPTEYVNKGIDDRAP